MAGNVKAFIRFRMLISFPCEWPGLAATFSHKFQLCFAYFALYCILCWIYCHKQWSGIQTKYII